jgi:hypothetical protein
VFHGVRTLYYGFPIINYYLWPVAVSYRPDLDRRVANLRGPHRRGRRFGSNRIELQKKALRRWNHWGAQNCTSRLSRGDSARSAKDGSYCAGPIRVDNTPPVRLARTCQPKTLRGRVRRFSPAPTAQPPRKRSGIRDRASDDTLERGGRRLRRPPTDGGNREEREISQVMGQRGRP